MLRSIRVIIILTVVLLLMHLPVKSIDYPFQDGRMNSYELSVIYADGATMDSGKDTLICIRLRI